MIKYTFYKNQNTYTTDRHIDRQRYHNTVQYKQSPGPQTPPTSPIRQRKEKHENKNRTRMLVRKKNYSGSSSNSVALESTDFQIQAVSLVRKSFKFEADLIAIGGEFQLDTSWEKAMSKSTFMRG